MSIHSARHRTNILVLKLLSKLTICIGSNNKTVLLRDVLYKFM